MGLFTELLKAPTGLRRILVLAGLGLAFIQPLSRAAPPDCSMEGIEALSESFGKIFQHTTDDLRHIVTGPPSTRRSAYYKTVRDIILCFGKNKRHFLENLETLLLKELHRSRSEDGYSRRFSILLATLTLPSYVEDEGLRTRFRVPQVLSRVDVIYRRISSSDHFRNTLGTREGFYDFLGTFPLRFPVLYPELIRYDVPEVRYLDSETTHQVRFRSPELPPYLNDQHYGAHPHTGHDRLTMLTYSFFFEFGFFRPALFESRGQKRLPFLAEHLATIGTVLLHRQNEASMAGGSDSRSMLGLIPLILALTPSPTEPKDLILSPASEPTLRRNLSPVSVSKRSSEATLLQSLLRDQRRIGLQALQSLGETNPELFPAVVAALRPTTTTTPGPSMANHFNWSREDSILWDRYGVRVRSAFHEMDPKQRSGIIQALFESKTPSGIGLNPMDDWFQRFSTLLEKEAPHENSCAGELI